LKWHHNFGGFRILRSSTFKRSSSQ